MNKMDTNSPESHLALGSNPQLRFGKIEELGSRVSAAIAAAKKQPEGTLLAPRITYGRNNEGPAF